MVLALWPHPWPRLPRHPTPTHSHKGPCGEFHSDHILLVTDKRDPHYLRSEFRTWRTPPYEFPTFSCSPFPSEHWGMSGNLGCNLSNANVYHSKLFKVLWASVLLLSKVKYRWDTPNIFPNQSCLDPIYFSFWFICLLFSPWLAYLLWFLYFARSFCSGGNFSHL